MIHPSVAVVVLVIVAGWAFFVGVVAGGMREREEEKQRALRIESMPEVVWPSEPEQP